MKTNKYLDSFSDIKEGITIAEKSGFLNQVLEFKFMLVELFIQNKNFSEATELMQGRVFFFFDYLEISPDILHRPNSLKMDYYYHKTILLMSMVKNSVLPTEDAVLESAQSNLAEALRLAILLEDLKKIKKFLFMLANILNMRFEYEQRNAVSVELKKFKLMESSWKKLSNKILILEDPESCFRLHDQVHKMMNLIAKSILTALGGVAAG